MGRGRVWGGVNGKGKTGALEYRECARKEISFRGMQKRRESAGFRESGGGGESWNRW